jgi:hypothetical protein
VVLLVLIGSRAEAQVCSAWRVDATLGAALTRVASSGSLLVAVGDGIYTSQEGIVWQRQVTPAGAFLNDLTWAGDQFVAVGNKGLVLTSPTGLVWTQQNGTSIDNLNAVAWGGGQFLAAGAGPSAYVSPDGAGWHAIAKGDAAFYGLFVTSLAWNGTVFAVLTDDFPVYAFNGSAWNQTQHSVGPFPRRQVAWNGSRLVAVGTQGGVITSFDAQTWSSKTSRTSLTLNGVAAGDAMWVAVGAGGTILSSPDGDAWSVETSPTTAQLQGVTWTGSRFVAVGDGGVVVSSECGAATSLWVPVASHKDGANNSRWRSDLDILNATTALADVEVRLYTTSNVRTTSVSVPPGSQVVLEDVAGLLGVIGSAAVEVRSDRRVQVFSRTYNLVASDLCNAGATIGQEYQAWPSGAGLRAGDTASLPGLAQNLSFRCNIGLVNAGPTPAAATITLLDAAGITLAIYPAILAPGQWRQEDQPFLNKAHRNDLDHAFARVSVTSGSGVFALASVVDNTTNDATTVTMTR